MMVRYDNHEPISQGLLAISDDDIDVWYVNPDRVDEGALECWYAERITPDERWRCDRFVFAKDRRMCLVARGLIRAVLSRYREVPVAAWRFGKNRHGKPYVESPAVGRDLSFNLAHTEGLVVCSVAVGREVGVDVENLRREAPMDIASRYFGPSECAHLASLGADELSEAFFTYWTLKEAYIKARGLGLTIPLNRMEFRFTDLVNPVVEFSPEMGDDPQRWQFFLPDEFRPGNRVAVAAATTGTKLNRLRVRATNILV